MKKSTRWLLGLFLMQALFSLCFAARWHYQIAFNSSYIWRGFDLNPSQQPVLQPAIGYRFGESGLTLQLWGSFSFASKDANEVDLTLAYTRTFAQSFFLKVGVTGAIWSFENNDGFARKNSREVFVSFGCSSCSIRPRFTIFYDFGDGDGFYLQADMAYLLRISPNWAGNLFVSAGYNGGQWLADGVETGTSDVNVGASLSYGKGAWRITPYVHYTFGLLEALGKKDYFWYGISVTYGGESHFPGLKWF